MMPRNQPRSAQYPTRPGEAHLDFAGGIGEPITVTGTITRKEQVLGSFYSTVSTLLEIDCGTSIITIFSTARWAEAAEIGEQVTVAGTVKKHQHWRGTPQTVLGWTHCVDTIIGSQPAPTGQNELTVTQGWPAGEVTIRRRFPDDPNPAAPPDVPPQAAADWGRR